MTIKDGGVWSGKRLPELKFFGIIFKQGSGMNSITKGLLSIVVAFVILSEADDLSADENEPILYDVCLLYTSPSPRDRS